MHNSSSGKDKPKQVLIVGGGFTGTMVAVHLLTAQVLGKAPESGRGLEIILLEKQPRVGTGLAYSTECPRHLLNVPAGRMSAYPDQPEHFLQFASRVDGAVTKDSFVPRSLYGRYLQTLIEKAAGFAAEHGIRYEIRQGEAVDVERMPASSRWSVTLANGDLVLADYLILATGNIESKLPVHFNQALLNSGRYMHNPWLPEKITAINADDNVLLLGAGLTAVDKILELKEQNHRGKIIAVSRHGLLPRGHVSPAPLPLVINAEQLPGTACGMLAFVRKLIGVGSGGTGSGNKEKEMDWRCAIDALRPHSQTWWQSLSSAEQARFSRHLKSIWNVYRHRMAPVVKQTIDGLIADGQLVVQGGRILGYDLQPDGVSVSFKKRFSTCTTDFTVQKIINCTGFGGAVKNLDSRLFAKMIERGLAKVHALGGGIEADNDGRVLGRDGMVQSGLLAAGPVLQAHRFESVAVPELSKQCQCLAGFLLADVLTSDKDKELPGQKRLPANPNHSACQPETEALIVEQIYLNCLSQASYLVADRETGVAAVIDPRRDVDIYLQTAEKLGVEIKHIILTHIHADFIAGHPELHARTGAPIYMGMRAAVSFPVNRLADGDSIDLGAVRLSVMETPGHTPEGICIVASDRSQDGRIKAVFTGDTLLVGDAGRPDLFVSSGLKSEQLADMLFDSLQRLSALPDETVLYPGHGPGSLCGKQLGSQTHSTIGSQRKFNNALRLRQKDEFVQYLCSSRNEPPSYFAYDAAINTGDRPLLEAVVKEGLTRLDFSQLLCLKEKGAQLLDVRMGDEFARGHIDGAVNVSLAGQFASWAGNVLDCCAPIYVLCHVGQEQEAILRLARIGLNAGGYFNYPANLSEFGAATSLRSYSRLSADELEELWATGRRPAVLDVSDADEWEQRHIPGSINIPLVQLVAIPLPLLNSMLDGGLTVVHCQSGYRSTIAMSLLLNHGYDNICELIGGIAEWTVP